MRTFDKLSKTHVNISPDNGKSYFTCKMLPISKLKDLKAILSKIDEDTNFTTRIECREQLIAMIRTVFPPEKEALLERFDIIDAIEMAQYLMYGFGDSEPDEGQKKIVYPSQRKQAKAQEKQAAT